MKVILKTIILSVILASFIGCFKKNNASNEKVINKENTINEYIIGDSKGDWGSPSPYGIIPRGPGFIRLNLTFDTLLWKDKEGMIIPSLASSWSYDDNTISYTFSIDNRAKWHDGKKIKASDVEFTINYIKEHPLEWVDLSMIKNVKINNNSIKITLHERSNNFYISFATGVPILPQHIYKYIENPRKNYSKEQLIGSGPYTLKRYNIESGEYLFERFDDYYLGKPKVKKIRFHHINKQLQLNSLLNGSVDAIEVDSHMAKILKQKKMNIIKSEGMVTKLSFNHKKEPFNKKEFRQAIAYLIDRNELINISKQGAAIPISSGGLSVNSRHYNNNINNYTFNVKEANRLLEDLGYTKVDGYYKKDSNILEIQVLGYKDVEKNLEIISKQLNKNGIKTSIKIMDLQVTDQMISEWDYDMAIIEVGAMGDPIFLNRNILSDSPSSDRYLKSEELKYLLNLQPKILDESKRSEILKRIQCIYSKELPSYYLYYDLYFSAFNNKLDLHYTRGGISIGNPSPYNKLVFVK